MPTKRRKWWLSGLLSIATTGLGQIYNGQVKKGLLFYSLILLLALIAIFLIMSGLFPAPFNVVIPFIFVIFAYLYSIIDAVISAKKLGNTYGLRDYNKWYIYLAIIAIFGVVVPQLLSLTIRGYLVQAFKIPSGPMEPTLIIGDHILVDKYTYRFKNADRNDVIVFIYPLDASKVFIKRVVALEGDRVEIINKKLYINGAEVTESYAVFKDDRIIAKGEYKRDNFGPAIVPKGVLFVLGDNRDQSLDSRFWGFVPLEYVLGKAFIIYWSWDRQRMMVRWERIGGAVR